MNNSQLKIPHGSHKYFYFLEYKRDVTKIFSISFYIKASQNKRMKTEVATLEYDLTALKKVGAQQRNDLKQIGNLIMTELKTLREKTGEAEVTLTKENKISAKFTADLPVLVTSLRVVGSGLADLRKDVASLRQTSLTQLEATVNAVGGMHGNSNDVTSELIKLSSAQEALQEVVRTQTASIWETVKGQGSILDTHSQSMEAINDVTESSTTSLDSVTSELNQRFDSIKADVASTLAEWRSRQADTTSLVDKHDQLLGQLGSEVQSVNSELHVLLQDVDVQVNSSQMRLEAMVVMASEKAQNMREDMEARSMDDRRHVSHELHNQSERVVQALERLSARLDDLDGMYDDMQERLYEVDKTRKNNLVFYGIPQQQVNEDPDECERLVKSVMKTKLQVSICIQIVAVQSSTIL
jgi:hypothetical protein